VVSEEFKQLHACGGKISEPVFLSFNLCCVPFCSSLSSFACAHVIPLVVLYLHILGYACKLVFLCRPPLFVCRSFPPYTFIPPLHPVLSRSKDSPNRSKDRSNRSSSSSSRRW
jgi:hypothetical protein